MPMTVRRCTKCGREDDRERWDSFDEATRAGAMRAAWSCPSCAWPEAELVDAGSAPGRATPQGESGPQGRPEVDPERPVDPDEARRRTEAEFPLRR